MSDSYFLRWARDNGYEPDGYVMQLYLQSDDWKADFQEWSQDRLSERVFVREQVNSLLDHDFDQALAADLEAKGLI
jgi:hypothetical protein